MQNNQKNHSRLLFLIFFALYFPMVGKLLPILKDLPFNPLLYSVLIILFIIFFNIPGSKKSLKDLYAYPFFKASLIFVLIIFFKGIISGDFQFITSKISGIVLGILLIITFFKANSSDLIDFRIERLSNILGGYLILQVLVSIIEAKAGYFLGEYEIKVFEYDNISGSMQLGMSSTGIYDRDIFSLVGLSQFDIFGFKFPFAGLIGQHNGFGSMLVFYNVIFLYNYIKNRSVKNIAFVFLVLFAIMANATRISFFIILFSDFIIFIYLVKSKFIKKASISFIIISILFFGYDFLQHFISVFQSSDTLSARVVIWNYILSFYEININTLSFIFGLSVDQILSLGWDFFGRTMGSYENQYIYNFIYFGVIGFVYFLYAYGFDLYKRSKKLSSDEKLIGYIYLFCIVVLSITLDTIYHYATFFLISIIYYTLYISKEKINADNKNIV